MNEVSTTYDSIFSFDHYKSYIKARAESSKETGILSRIAKGAGCQLSYLSRVLRGDVHITPDQAYRLCEFWQFSLAQREYFLTLVDWERAGDRLYKNYLGDKLEEIRRSNQNLSTTVRNPVISASSFDILYHSSWHWTAIHLLTSVPEFHSVARIAQRLSLSPAFTEHTLQTLATEGYVKFDQGKWTYVSGGGHIPKQSPPVIFHHQNWRTRAVTDAQNPQSDGIHFTAVQTLSKKDFERFRHMLVEFIAKYSEIATPSAPEEMATFTCDFFRS